MGEATTASLASGGGTAVSYKDSDSVSWRAGGTAAATAEAQSV